MATDGCSVMRGKHTGLIVHLKNEIPHDLLSVHFVAHDLQLAILDASGDLNYMTTKFDPTLKPLFPLLSLLFVPIKGLGKSCGGCESSQSAETSSPVEESKVGSC